VDHPNDSSLGFAIVEVRFHKSVQADLDEILRKYNEVSRQLGEDFFAEFQIGISKAVENPRRFHFDRIGLRRCNLERFHFLYDIRGEHIRIGCCAMSAVIRISDWSGSPNSDVKTAAPNVAVASPFHECAMDLAQSVLVRNLAGWLFLLDPN